MLVMHVFDVGRIRRWRDPGVVRKVMVLLQIHRMVIRIILAQTVRIVRMCLVCKSFDDRTFGTSGCTSLTSSKRITPTVLCSLHALCELLMSRSYDDRLKIKTSAGF
jgi:hypothetical protein